MGKKKRKAAWKGRFLKCDNAIFLFFFSFTEGVLKCERIECELGKLNIKAS